MKQPQRIALLLAIGLAAGACGSSDPAAPGGGDPGGGDPGGETGSNVTTGNPILFVTQVPIPSDFRTITSSFGNHLGDPHPAGRGGDLYLRYEDGTLRNLTAEAGFGEEGLQGANSISVRQPSVHWSGTKAVFSMVVGAPTAQGQAGPWFFQLYEVTGFGPGDTATITKVPGQPADANNVAPTYASDDRILFTSDRPRASDAASDDVAHLYPQLDEYEEAVTTTGLWSLDPASGELFLMQHSPSGSYTPIVASSGLVMFTRWDHLVRDQQADLERQGVGNFTTWNWSDESPSSVPTQSNDEVFPEPLNTWIQFIEQNPGYTGPLAGYEPHLTGNTFNHFSLWQVRQDGSEEETAIHIGRQELHVGVPRSRKDDPAITDFYLDTANQVANKNAILNLFMAREDPLQPGRYLAVDAHEHRAHTSGQLITLTVPDGTNPDDSVVGYVTPRSTYDDVPTPDHSGHYRNPVPMSDGQWLAVHTPHVEWDTNLGTEEFPDALYEFRLVELTADFPYLTAGEKLTEGISKSVQYWNPDVLVSYDGEFWELDPVEVVARPAPAATLPSLPDPEMQVLQFMNVDLQNLVAWLKQKDLALIVSRDVTQRDANDRQQPFNLQVPGGQAKTIGAPGDTVYDVAHLQLFQADQLRSISTNAGVPVPGRRVLPQPMHDDGGLNVPNPTGPAGSVAVAPDGSTAALVPARRAMSWQTTDGSGEPVVRERYWLTFQPGEVRTCTVCHGLNSQDQAGALAPSNQPEALRILLQHLKSKGEL